jgi:hypothetical protein
VQPRLLESARKRSGGVEWKWRKVINETAVRKGREKKGFEKAPFTKEFRDQEKEFRAQKRTKRGKSKKGEDEDESDDEDDD